MLNSISKKKSTMRVGGGVGFLSPYAFNGADDEITPNKDNEKGETGENVLFISLTQSKRY